MAKRHHSEHAMHGSYEGHESRRKQEMEDGGMISEDRSKIANMPQEVMIKEYSRSEGMMSEVDARVDDTIRGVDRQKSEDGSKRNSHMGVRKV